MNARSHEGAGDKQDLGKRTLAEQPLHDGGDRHVEGDALFRVIADRPVPGEHRLRARQVHVVVVGEPVVREKTIGEREQCDGDGCAEIELAAASQAGNPRLRHAIS